MKIEVIKGDEGYWWFRIRAKNGKILASSEIYTTKRSAMNAAYLVRAGFHSDWPPIKVIGEKK